MSEPTKLKMWRAVRVTPPKVPQTLEDCEENRLVVVTLDGSDEWLIRCVSSGITKMSTGFAAGANPSRYRFVRYLDDPQPAAPTLPTTFGELRDGQCYRLPYDESVRWVRWRCGGYCAILTTNGLIEYGQMELQTPITFISDTEMVLEEQPC